MTEIVQAPVERGFAEPTRRVTGGWIALFATAWLGIWMAQLTPIQLLLPMQVEARITATAWQDKVIAFGIISGIAGVFALVAYPLTGLLSDRTTGRFGRRRPWIAVGTALFAISLVMLGRQHGLVGIGVWWTATLVGFCVLTAALTATISDQVPVNQRGFVSGWISAPQAVGTILGILLVTVLALGQLAGYQVMAALLVLLVAPFVIWVPDQPVKEVHPHTGFWISPRQFPDFGWTLLSRVLVNLGNAFGTTLLFYFLEDYLKVADAEAAILELTLVYMVFVVVASLVMGRLSDDTGRRKAFVWIASGLQGIAALMLAFVPQFGVAMAGAALLGTGYGCFLAVDQALATQVLPDPATRGKDLGIMNIASAVPQAIAPLIGAAAVLMTGSFVLVFVLSAVFAFSGALAVARVRSVR